MVPFSFASAACPGDDEFLGLVELAEELWPNRHLAEHVRNCRVCASKLAALRNSSTTADASPLESIASTVELPSPEAQGVTQPFVKADFWFSESEGAMTNRLSIGSRLGEYELQRELGRGGMGVVFLAWHPPLRRQVAIKVPQITGHAVNIRV